MNQVKIIIRAKKAGEVIKSLRNIDVGGFTMTDVEGKGRSDPPLAGDTFSMKQITTTIPNNKISDVFDNVSNVAYTGTKGDGEIFVSDIVDALDICNKKTGENAT